MISIIHPSRSRPKQAHQVAYKWLRNAGCHVEYILSLDDCDYNLYRGMIKEGYNAIVNPNRSAVDAINNAAKIATGNILIVMSDDFDCPSFWGRKVIDATIGRTDWIMKTPDGIQKRIITLPIMDRVYYERFGYIYNPAYRHMWADTEMTDVAERTGRLIKANIPFVHNHYSIGKSEKDEVSIRADATYEPGRAIYNERKAHNFYL